MVRVGFYVILLAMISACDADRALNVSAYKDVNEFQALQETQRAKTEFLAYTHQIAVDVDHSALSSVFNSVIETCVHETEYVCLIMRSEESGGEYAYGHITLRVSPNGIDKYKRLVTESGELAAQSMHAEDLTAAVKDTEKRLEMLNSYQARLQKLEQNPNVNVDALIKLSSEMAEVQTQIEFAQGQKAKLYQRINMDVLEITLQSSRDTTFYGPIGDALSTFADNVADGLSVFITAMAYLLPWLLLLMLLIWLLRLFWGRRKRRS
ncbi:hypothetical protein GCM10008090_27490 [Arenicella chitinivorans]|uniref:DUF4349 domain-containing protein n=1 Tax=Arenicella chitinivorans TaxID=1329800 RepID=A0A918VR50_9GAMM|nr:DUF4349 domain-containing protein [Arenicella chitinivorans]GHA16188.1 hypothetical protein GCM10008090_27490 [Arenicella chitinivorans]